MRRGFICMWLCAFNVHDILTNVVLFNYGNISLVMKSVFFFVIICLRSALIKVANNRNQDFQNALQSLDFFLVNLPNNAIKPTDDVAQITAKLNSQRVSRRMFLHTSTFLQLLYAN